MAEFVKDDQIVFVKGSLDRRRDPAELIISRIIPFEQGPAELARGVVVRLHKGIHQTEHLERLLRLVRVRPGNLDLYLELVGLEHVRRAIYRAGASLAIRYDDRLIADLEAVVGTGNVRLRGQGGATARVDAGDCVPQLACARICHHRLRVASRRASRDRALDDSLLDLADEV